MTDRPPVRRIQATPLAIAGGVALLLLGLVLILWPRSEGSPKSAAVGGNDGTAESRRSGPPAPSASREPDPAGQQDARTTDPSNGRLLISKLGVDAAIDEIGIRNRTLSPPKNPAVVGWWRDSPVPGASKGSTLMVGHTKKVPGMVGIGRGALGRISLLRKGDRIDVTGGGTRLEYRVTRVDAAASYTEVAESATSIDDRNYPGGRLVLITCWFDGNKFTGNTFVYADPVRSGQ